MTNYRRVYTERTDYILASTATTWVSWNTSSTGISTTNSSNPWSYWNNTLTNATTPGTADSWLLWQRAQLRERYMVRQAPVETPEQRVERERLRAEQSARCAEAAAKEALERAAAESRAEVLLRNHLTDFQKKQLDTCGWFDVVGKSGTKYRIQRGRSANVDVLDAQGRVTHALCAHPSVSVPDPDTMLSQLLAIRHEEADFLRIANRHPAKHAFRSRQPGANHPELVLL